MNIILHGCSGRMGKALSQLVSEGTECRIAAGIDRSLENSVDAGGVFKYPAYPSLTECKEEADVIIDFSNHEAVKELLEYCIRTQTPVVVATTALEQEDYRLMEKASETIPVFHSANMSIGINAVAKLMQTLMPALEKEFNVEIIEKHHTKKLDSPSGTALLLADAVNNACESKKDYIYGRHSKADECKMTDLGIHAVRGGTIPGEHTIIFAGPDEVIEITHTALSRNIFARGALKAAGYIAGRKNGLYTMAEIL